MPFISECLRDPVLGLHIYAPSSHHVVKILLDTLKATLLASTVGCLTCWCGLLID